MKGVNVVYIFFFMCDIPCILVYDCNKEVNCACVGEIITIIVYIYRPMLMIPV
jgi:hypothetical protein